MNEQIKEITPQEVEEQLSNGKQLNIIDVRENDEVEQGMITVAKHIRMGDIPQRLNELDKGEEYIIVCRSGGRSHNTGVFMQEQGYNVINMVGGMLAWTGDIKTP
ncbi:rhodanese-like domain-containing protein [Bacillus solimangrovi]|uniref:Rhodanese-like domain-containing protein n=1 Tax=Bacillus solimangrovi TaxID=1305675 RepID=A0A1E5LDH4_9BACI|nr:rhodanese-like domain-containing protein [Bacillus solimangrovi]OEH92131.1 rhodanese-like domain-containing protein [Bacillus solimangrovi]